MNFNKGIFAIDTHTMGEPTRIIIDGIPFMPNKTILEKKHYLEENLDYIRTSVLLEPRGHRDMFGAIIIEPTNEAADIGAIFMDTKGYLDMCGHGSMGVATIAVEYGLVIVNEPYTNINIETLAGNITARVRVEKGKAISVSIENVPSFVYKKDYKIELPEIGEVCIDISFGGNFFAIVDSNKIGVNLDISNINIISQMGLTIRRIINERLIVEHPHNKQINKVELVEFFCQSVNANLKNIVIFGQGQYDRSPCGTGTSAKLASLYARRLIKMNEEFTYESILGTIFTGKIIKLAQVGDYKAIIPEITGRSYITGFNHFFIDPEDPFKHGFNIG